MDASLTLQLSICTRNIEDFWSLGFEKTWRFSGCSTYHMLTPTKRHQEGWLDRRAWSSSIVVEDQSWMRLWKATVPKKLKNFLCHLLQQSLPTEDIAMHRKMASSSCCSVYGVEDSRCHSLIECSLSCCIWALVDQHMLEHMMATKPNVKKALLHGESINACNFHLPGVVTL